MVRRGKKHPVTAMLHNNCLKQSMLPGAIPTEMGNYCITSPTKVPDRIILSVSTKPYFHLMSTLGMEQEEGRRVQITLIRPIRHILLCLELEAKRESQLSPRLVNICGLKNNIKKWQEQEACFNQAH